ncbi:GTP-binding protein [Salinisphaera sp. Q1T1-3]|uniref:CobW family GTP-binding protein n=1 Tax=Salinisphaera sp. Q1T1-3 TaxID=2321229 RepID=UPI000E769F85|nr:GTP-binding protein [Salinisphaera sp. Q1T1-3]RJS92745.1 GTP-binding protein [Salinisphaera sp. Q1T1-3]
MTATDASLIPVNVVSGFLGAGKTSLLKRVLASEAFGESAVLINEFGDVGIDDLLLGEIAEDAVLLSSGCVCCTIRQELSEALARLLELRADGRIPCFKRVILETTGLADPGPIASTITADPMLRHHLRPGINLTVVDAIHAGDSETAYTVWADQVAAADKLIISKTDLADTDRVDTLRDRLTTINPTAEILGPDAIAQPTTALFRQGPHVARWGAAETRRWLGLRPVGTPAVRESAHPDTVSSFRLRLAGEVDWTCLGVWLSMLLNRHGQRILRVKGVLQVRGGRDPVIVHGVQHTIHPPEHVRDWPCDDDRSELVFITRGIAGDRIVASLDGFMKRVSAYPAPVISHV